MPGLIVSLFVHPVLPRPPRMELVPIRPEACREQFIALRCRLEVLLRETLNVSMAEYSTEHVLPLLYGDRLAKEDAFDPVVGDVACEVRAILVAICRQKDRLYAKERELIGMIHLLALFAGDSRDTNSIPGFRKKAVEYSVKLKALATAPRRILHELLRTLQRFVSTGSVLFVYEKLNGTVDIIGNGEHDIEMQRPLIACYDLARLFVMCLELGVFRIQLRIYEKRIDIAKSHLRSRGQPTVVVIAEPIVEHDDQELDYESFVEAYLVDSALHPQYSGKIDPKACYKTDNTLALQQWCYYMTQSRSLRVIHVFTSPQ